MLTLDNVITSKQKKKVIQTVVPSYIFWISSQTYENASRVSIVKLKTLSQKVYAFFTSSLTIWQTKCLENCFYAHDICSFKIIISPPYSYLVVTQSIMNPHCKQQLY